MIIIYKNITFDTTIDDVGELMGICDAGEEPGFGLLTIPTNHIQGMKRDGYYREIKYKGRDYKILPYVDLYDYENKKETRLEGINRDYESYNSDLNIVYFKWMLEKSRTKFQIDFTVDNPYWIFHDMCHVRDTNGIDVYTNAQLEENAFNTGLHLMIESGYIPSFTKDYISKIQNNYKDRFKADLDITEFKPYIIEEYDY